MIALIEQGASGDWNLTRILEWSGPWTVLEKRLLRTAVHPSPSFKSKAKASTCLFAATLMQHADICAGSKNRKKASFLLTKGGGHIQKDPCLDPCRSALPCRSRWGAPATPPSMTPRRRQTTSPCDTAPHAFFCSPNSTSKLTKNHPHTDGSAPDKHPRTHLAARICVNRDRIMAFHVPLPIYSFPFLGMPAYVPSWRETRGSG